MCTFGAVIPPYWSCAVNLVVLTMQDLFLDTLWRVIA